ncbi:MAG: PAS domain-containing sensor histidine kinase, partial [Cyanobacteria bacterium]|nr:PAS domain-containing sensor histidine kinase [Cyanobacteriota bacterium]
YSSQDIVGQSINIVMLPGEKFELPDQVLDQHNSTACLLELSQQRQGGTQIDVSLTLSPLRNDNGIVIGASAIVRELTQEGRAVLAKKKIDRAIMENAPIGIARLDQSLVILEGNQAFSEIFGLRQEGLAGTFIYQIPIGLPRSTLIDVLREEIAFSASNLRITSAQAETETREVFCDLTIWPTKDEEEQVVGLVILIAEVTERVRLAQQREDFIATLTHDLKNPLIGQNRLLDLILEGDFGPLDDKMTQVLRRLQGNSKELLESIGTLLEVYRYEKGAPQLWRREFDGKELIEECIAEIHPIARTRKVEIRSTVSEMLPFVFGDEKALRRVVINLLDNGVKFSPDSGIIELSLHFDQGEFTLAVEDSGKGIAEEEISFLFQRFAQTDQGRLYKSSSGLGLYLCRQIVESHGGEIFYERGRHGGARFVVKLPEKASNQ